MQSVACADLMNIPLRLWLGVALNAHGQLPEPQAKGIICAQQTVKKTKTAFPVKFEAKLGSENQVPPPANVSFITSTRGHRSRL